MYDDDEDNGKLIASLSLMITNILSAFVELSINTILFSPFGFSPA